MLEAISATVLTCGIIVACVSVHYETLRILALLQRQERRWYSQRLRAGLLVVGCILAHGIEVVLFGLGYWLMEYMHQGTDLQGTVPDGFNCVYYSVVVFTSIGFGDVVPVSRAMRIMTAAEGLAGAILIAWTASFMFFHMQRFWSFQEKTTPVEQLRSPDS